MTARVLLLLAGAVLLAGCGGEEPPETTPEEQAELRTRSEAFAGLSVARLRDEPEAMALGERLFAAHCASCHGTQGRGIERGVPNLAAGIFDYGAGVEAIRTTIVEGRHSEMPALGREVGEVDLGVLVDYVQAFAADESLSNFSRSARRLYEQHCSECHGPEGQGAGEQGVPDLTDDFWQHGDSMMNIRLTITRGAESSCPAHGDILTGAEINLLTAYVQVLSGAAPEGQP